ITERHDGVLTITINRPAQKNAVSREVAVQLASALDQLDADPTLSVGVLTGAGGTFSAGMDLTAFATGQTPVLAGRAIGGRTPAGDSGAERGGGSASRASRPSKDGGSAVGSRWCCPAT